MNGTDIKEMRQSRGMRQGELAMRLRISQAQLSRLEAGKREIGGPVEALLEPMLKRWRSMASPRTSAAE